MNFRFLLSGALLVLGAALAAPADTIVLKNGRRIEAWRVEETDDRVSYETPAGRISLPKGLVERIERNDARPARSPRDLPGASGQLPVPDLPELYDSDVARVIAGERVDQRLLARFDRAARNGEESARRRAAAAYALAAREEARRGQTAEAAEHLQSALRFAPEHPALLLNLAAVEMRRQRFTAALEALRPVLKHEKEEYFFHAHRLQGAIYYQREELQRAVRAWERALAARPDPELKAALAQIRREADAAEDLERRASGRFVLRYPEGEMASSRLAREILARLNDAYGEMTGVFALVPREPIVVQLYPNQTFSELTGMPPQVHGLYDGKVRVPVRGLVSVTRAFERVLRHELAHAFIFLKSRGRAPRWLQEGLAQVQAGQRPGISPRAFEPLFAPRDGSALGRIEAAFRTPGQVFAAYAASRLVVDTLLERYGPGTMRELLEALARGQSVQQALRAVYRLTLVNVDREVYTRLR